MNQPKQSSGKIKLGLLGASGRIGSIIQQLLEKDYVSRIELVAKVSQHDKLDSLFSADVVIDFSLPVAFQQFVKASAGKTQLPLIVTGTTGWSPAEWAEVEALAKRTHLLSSSNFSIGVFFLKEILKFTSSRFRRAGYDPVLIEKHHIHKLDSPSGTAITLREVIAPDRPESVQTHSIRAGEVIGDHDVTFYGPGDTIILGHRAQDRTIFARGAIEAALWIKEHSERTANSGKILSMETFFQERYGN